MRLLAKSAVVLSVAGAMAIGADDRLRGARSRGWVGGAAGFAAGAAIGAAAANANAAYYGPGYSSYGYAPTYGYYEPVRPTAYTRRSGVPRLRLQLRLCSGLRHELHRPDGASVSLRAATTNAHPSQE